jgi:GNAT superfamily N-acetyltransferase
MTGARFALSRLVFRPATPARWPDVERLFGERGACGGCWCMTWRLTQSRFEAGKGPGNKRAFKKLVTSGQAPGVIAYFDREPIGWCAVAPRDDYPRLGRSRVLAPVDDKEVWSISCLFILKAYRRRGVSARLIAAAVDFAGKRGATVVEGYPIEPTMAKTPDPFLWTGLPQSFLHAGFREVARRSKSRPIMRRAVRARTHSPGRQGHTNVQGVTA